MALREDLPALRADLDEARPGRVSLECFQLPVEDEVVVRRPIVEDHAAEAALALDGNRVVIVVPEMVAGDRQGIFATFCLERERIRAPLGLRHFSFPYPRVLVFHDFRHHRPERPLPLHDRPHPQVLLVFPAHEVIREVNLLNRLNS